MDAVIKLKQNLQSIVDDAEELLKATASQTGERVEKTRARVEESLRAARRRLAEVGSDAAYTARKAARDVDDQVHDHPYAAAGIAAGIGFLLGLVIGRNS
jgi:ElaB/YqjD/DUF883 family membrane-anchored ribosome-binding protein